MKAKVLCKDIAAASGLLRALSNPNRLAIVCLLLEGERPVMELEAVLGIRQPTLSQQLTALRQAGLIAGRRAQRTVFYGVTDARAAAVVKALRPMYPDLLPAAAVLSRGMDRASLVRDAALARLAEREAM